MIGETTALLEWVENWAAGVSSVPDLVLVRGDGAHVEALRRRWPAALLVIMDRNSDRPGDELTSIETESALFQARARRALVARLDVWRCAPPDELLAASPREEEFRAAVAQALSQGELEHGTLATLGQLWLSNLATNLPVIAESASIQRVGLAWRGSAVLVAGAGPSLTTVIDQLRVHRERTVVLAASSALRPLYKQGIIPDAVAVIEARDCNHHFDGVPLEVLQQIVLLGASHTHPAHWAWPWAARVSFHGPAAGWLVPWTGRGTLIPTAGNVGTTMLVMAWMLGGFPVMAAGLDFALESGEYYASGAGSSAEEHRHHARQSVTGWRGETLQATPELIAYREGTELTLQQISCGDPVARFLSVTGRGARVQGMQFAPWSRLAPELSYATRDGLQRAALLPASRPPAAHTVTEIVTAHLDKTGRDLSTLQRHPRGVDFAVCNSQGHTAMCELLLNIARQQVSGTPQADPLYSARLLRNAWNDVVAASTTSV